MEEKVTIRRKRAKVIPYSYENDDSNSSVEKQEKNKKRKIMKERLLELARKKNPEKYDFEENDSDSEAKCQDENLASSESDEYNTSSVEETKIFTSKLSRPCQLEGCKNWFREGITKIMGVKIPSQPKPDGNLHWICAKHSKFVYDDTDDTDDTDTDDTDDTDDNDDTNDSDDTDDKSQGVTVRKAQVLKEMAEIKMILSRRRPEDERNRERYMAEIPKYQLKIRSLTNPALYLSEEKRLEKNNRETRRDVGLNQERSIEPGSLENQFWKDVSVSGKRVRVFPEKLRLSKYTYNCPACDVRIIKDRSLVVQAQLRWRRKLEFNSRKKPFYICASHADSD